MLVMLTQGVVTITEPGEKPTPGPLPLPGTALVYVNGRLLNPAEARVSVADRGFLYGDGLYETMAVYGGQAFMLQAHLDRMMAGAAVIGLDLDRPSLEEAVLATLRANALRDGYLRLTVTAGDGGSRLDRESSTPTVVVTARHGRPYPESTYRQGLKVITSGIRRNPSSPLVRIKSLNFLENVLARREARAAGADEGLMLNLQGKLAEGTVSNLFLVKGGKLITPDEGSGLLPGITRGLVLRLAREQGLLVEEKEVAVADLVEADEAFLTNSLMEVVPLVEVDGRPLGGGKPGPLTRALASAYRREVEKA